MRLSATFLLLNGLAVSAAAIRRNISGACCFSLYAQGDVVSGHVGEDALGENGVGIDFLQGVYCIADGFVADNAGHNCTILSCNGQFVCKANSSLAGSHFTLADDGNLLHNENPYYFACPNPGVSTDGSYNIFSDSIADINSCTRITLLTAGFSCAALGRPSTTNTSTTSTTSSTSTTSITATSTQLQFVTAAAPEITQSPTTTATPSCPTDISSGTYISPNLIIPVSPVAPDTSYGTQYVATINPSNSTIFAFDIPYTYTGTCTLIFTFPFGSDAQFPYIFSGIEEESSSAHSGLDFALRNGYIDEAMTWDELPPVGEEYGVMKVYPGGNCTIAVAPCAAGERVGYLVESVGGVVLEFFQSTGGSPIGLWVVPCK
jgi:hypothetical protein